LLSYHTLKDYQIQSKYKLTAISQAAGKLAQMKKDIKKGRQTRHVNQYLHKITKDIIQKARETRSAIILEDIKGIRKLYRKGNCHGNKFRRKMNSWSFYEFQRQLQYKAAWGGVPVMFVDPKRISQLCPVCGGTLKRTGHTVVNCGALIVGN
ncbi:MAG: IS200/IS605 family accessory protein TnpB-related protein, partial [Nitrososphaera sp.]